MKIDLTAILNAIKYPNQNYIQNSKGETVLRCDVIQVLEDLAKVETAPLIERLYLDSDPRMRVQPR